MHLIHSYLVEYAILNHILLQIRLFHHANVQVQCDIFISIALKNG